jgi:NADH-quinone oxidoreductase subunit B
VGLVVPVVVFVPGGPPRPESLIYGILLLQEKIARSRA